VPKIYSQGRRGARVVVFRNVISPREVQIAVHTNLDEGSVAEFRGALYAELDQPEQRILLDLSRVHSVNSAALGAILLVQKRARESGKEIVIARCSDELRATLLAIRLDRIVEILGESPPTFRSEKDRPTQSV
jgi:anti-anti-sigma factor